MPRSSMLSRFTQFRVSRLLMRNAALMYGAAVTAGGVQYLALVIVARALGPHRLGVVVLATSISSFVAAAVELGVGPVLIRFRPTEEGDPRLWSAVVRSMIRIVTLSVVSIVFLAVLALGFAALDSHQRTASVTAVFALSIAALTVALTFFQSYLIAYSRFVAVATLGVGMAAVRLLLVISLAVAGNLSTTTVLATYLVTVGGAAAGAWWVTLRGAALPVGDRAMQKRAKSLVAPFLRWTMIGRAIVALVGRLDIFLISILAGPTTTGVYSAASQSAAPMGMLASAVGEVSFPHLVARERLADGRGAIRRWFRWLPILITGGSAIAVCGAYLLPRIMGPRFGSSDAPFAVLVISWSLQVWLQPIGAFLYASDRHRRAVLIAVAQTVVVIGLDLALIPLYGALGAALAILIMTCMTAPVMVYAALRRRPVGSAVIELSEA